MCQTTSQILYSVESDIIHVEIVVAGVVGVQDELLGGVGSGVEEDVLDKGHRRVSCALNQPKTHPNLRIPL